MFIPMHIIQQQNELTTTHIYNEVVFKIIFKI